MYQKIVLVLGCMTSTMLYAQKGKGFEIKGQIEGKQSGWLYLERTADKKILDSTQVQNGKFSFKGKVAEPMLYSVRNGDASGALYVENTVMNADYNTNHMYAPKVTGSVSDSAYRKFWKSFEVYNKSNMQLNQHINELFKIHKPGTPGYESAMDSVKLLEGNFVKMITQFITENPASPVAAFVIEDRMVNYGNIEKVKAFMTLLKPKAVQSFYGRRIQEALNIAAKTAVGASLSFSQPDTSGKKVKLSDLKAKYILVDFWASWCGPCRKENPNVVAAYNKYHEKGFDIIGISLDNNKAAWLKAIEKDGLTWTHVSDLKGWKNAVAEKYGIKVVPASLLVDNKGKIVARNLKGDDLHKELEKLLK